MTIQYYVASSLDGFIADSDNRIDWLLRFGTADFDDGYQRFLAGIGAIVMGSRTYEFLLSESMSEWPYSVPTVVLTRRDLPIAVSGADIRFLSGEIEAVAAELGALSGDRAVWVVGGGDVAAQFASAGLLSTVIVTMMPVVLGSGIRVLPVTELLELELVSSVPLPQGAVELTYAVTGSRDT
ncbi:dihydrofolate reductase family protein [Agreia sp. PsM10]|uniref:dihydrofolate reductase family protein n=1 Tax=Agreia sp. PsM10 TaxID=3030533 RepID=UPI00263AC7DF|nr:dihydrofolate reductase family protein [Agreia sp. PsM10]MDN4639717.1 dihydrofolate reductase family protein [Agreia sp. PsM10]